MSDNCSMRAANIALSKTVLTPNVLSPYLPAFIATLTYAIWHGRPFADMSARPPHGLKQFARFTMDLLRATGLSFSVVLLALKFVHKLKSRRPELRGAEGSECRLLVCTLMLAMKYLMDNTYSNKTWHKVSRIPLQEINVTEMEFLAQVNFDLHVEEEDYFQWLSFIENAVVEFRRITNEVQQQPVSPQSYQPASPVSPAVQQQQKLRLHCHPSSIAVRTHFPPQPSPPVTPSSAISAGSTIAPGSASTASVHHHVLPPLPTPTCPQPSGLAQSSCSRQQLDSLPDFAAPATNPAAISASSAGPSRHYHNHQHYPSPYSSPSDGIALSSVAALSVAAGHARAVRGA